MKPSAALIFHALFIISFLLIHRQASSNLIQPSCKQAANADPNLRYEFCVASLCENPESQNTTLEGLAVISTNKAISNATRIQKMISRILLEKAFDKHTKTALHDCLDLYSSAKSSLTEALLDIKSRDYETAHVELSSAMDASSTCEGGFVEEKSQKSPLTEENNVFFQMTVIPLAFINML